MFIVPKALKVYLAGKAGVIGSGSQLHLKAECQVILPVWILQILDRPLRRLAQSVEKHNLRRVPAIHLGDQMQVFPYPVPVDIKHHLDGGILLQYIGNSVQCIIICLAPVQLAVFQVIHRFVVVYIVALGLQQPGQAVPNTHHGLSGSGILISFLGMCVVNKYLRLGVVPLHGHVTAQQVPGIHQITARRGGGMDAVKMFYEEVVIHQLFQHICIAGNGALQCPRYGLQGLVWPLVSGCCRTSCTGCQVLAAFCFGATRTASSSAPDSFPSLSSSSCARSGFPRGQDSRFLRCLLAGFLIAVPGKILVFFIKCFNRVVFTVSRIRVIDSPGASPGIRP